MLSELYHGGNHGHRTPRPDWRDRLGLRLEEHHPGFGDSGPDQQRLSVADDTRVVAGRSGAPGGAEAGGAGQEVGDPGLHRLPGRRKKAEDAQAPSQQLLRPDPQRVSGQVGFALGLPDGRPELRQVAVRDGGEDRPGSPRRLRLSATVWSGVQLIQAGARRFSRSTLAANPVAVPTSSGRTHSP